MWFRGGVGVGLLSSSGVPGHSDQGPDLQSPLHATQLVVKQCGRLHVTEVPRSGAEPVGVGVGVRVVLQAMESEVLGKRLAGAVAL